MHDDSSDNSTLKKNEKHTPEKDADANENGPNEAVSAAEGAEPLSVDPLEECRAEVAQLKEQLLRKAAEFENFRKRTREEQTSLVQFSNEGLILELLPVLDDFERSLKAGKEHRDFDSFYTGTELVRNKLMKILEHRGLKAMESVGTQFDVEFHDALLQIPESGKEPGSVIDEVEKGYTLHSKVIRHAKVTVAS